jgi:hypothetical protein
MCFWTGTDFMFVCTEDINGKFNGWSQLIIPTSVAITNIWSSLYANVCQANLILTRIENASLLDADKKAIRGQALFFRGYSYNLLANMYGGVPVFVDEISAPRRDFVRATREETYTQAKNDFEEAISLLGNIDGVKDGQVSKQLAQHFLAEVYISLGNYDKAIEAATATIDYSGTKLMTSRFGSHTDEPGDVYTDMYKTNNQNRSSGNWESLWVLQYDYLNAGSAMDSQWSYFNPRYADVVLTVDGITTTAFLGNTSEKGGRSTAWSQGTKYFYDEIWEPGDIRNSEYMIVRDLQIDNPASPAFGKWLIADGYVQEPFLKQWYPFLKKFAGITPSDYYQLDNNGNPMLTPFGEHLIINISSTWRDEYLVRLADTYLLRAEAYLGKNNQAAAATDINAVRSRAHAPLANAAEINIDYILDERLRELYGEELRLATLMRLGKFVDRVRRYNAFYYNRDGKEFNSTGRNIEDYHNLLPIPYTEIERNVFAVLEQNPGYSN